jgi:hypothetical protein
LQDLGEGLRIPIPAPFCPPKLFFNKLLAGKIGELVVKGVLLKRDADYLHQHRFLGNEAVHEMEAPPAEESAIALEILEHLLTTIYVIPRLDRTLRKLRIARGAKVR